MKIMIYDCAAESGGALTVLKQHYEKSVLQKEYEYCYIISVVTLEEKDNIKVINLPWVKKSWFHRLYCDYVFMPRLVSKLKPDSVVSLQNIGIPRIKQHQTIYVHNVIPFTEHKFSLTKEPMLYIYQNIIGRMIRSSLKKAGKIIVQTDWMKNKIEEICKIDEQKITVEKMLSTYSGGEQRIQTKVCSFFYPAYAVKYKNHEVLIKACQRLKAEGIEDYKVYLTITGEDNALAKKIVDKCLIQELPVTFLGTLDRQEMENMYRSSVLVFPSYLETVGLPLVEAQSFNAHIISADCLYSRDAIGNYRNCLFFNAEDDVTLSLLMKKEIEIFPRTLIAD